MGAHGRAVVLILEKFLFSVPVRRRYLIQAVGRNYSARKYSRAGNL